MDIGDRRSAMAIGDGLLVIGSVFGYRAIGLSQLSGYRSYRAIGTPYVERDSAIRRCAPPLSFKCTKADSPHFSARTILARRVQYRLA
jgi:hypothetical protein